MLHTDFLFTSLDRIQQWTTFDDVVAEIETTGHWLGGSIFFPEHIRRLGTLVLNESSPPIKPVNFLFPTTVQMYAIPAQLVQAVVKHTIEELLDLSVPWSDVPEWSDINRFDLGGFLVSFRGLCEDAITKQMNVYLIVTSDEDWSNPSSNI